jgi:hypothetical protein
LNILNTVSHWNRAWILATITSLMLFDIYWVQSAYNRIYLDLIQNRPSLNPSNFWLDHTFGATADTLRIVAVILLFFVAYMVWGPKKQSFSAVKKYLAAAILLEGIYWLAVLPENVKRIVSGYSPVLLYVGFFIEIVAAGMFLIILGVKVLRHNADKRKNLIKWGCIAGISYIFAMWIYNLFRWFSMSGLLGVTDPRIAVNLFSGISSFGFLNVAITLTLSLAFAIAGSYTLINLNSRKLAIQLIGIAILLFGLYFALYTIYAWFSPSEWRFLLVLTQIWPIPLIGLGIGLLRGRI